MRYGAKVLFEEVAVTFVQGRRYGLTGPNGAGKSTLMKILSGEIDAQKGTVTRPKRMSVLKQDQFAFDAYRVIDTVIMGNARLWSALEEREVLYSKADMTDEDGIRLGELEGIVGEEDGYSADSDAAILLGGLGIPEELHERKMSELQGGQKVRVLLAQALFGNPEALLLDEPTNHLDLDSIHWLQDFLNNFKGTMIVISHDRHFLNSVCTHTADIDYQTIIVYTGGYDDMVMAKTQVRARVEADNAQREKKIAQLNEFISRFSAGTRASQVRSRAKEVERLEVSDLKRSNIARPFIKFVSKRPSGKHPLEVRNLTRSYGDQLVFKPFSTHVTRGERIAILGRNGAGKTTLLRALLDNGPVTSAKEKDLATGSGEVTWGHETSIGYFAQDHRELMKHPTQSTLDFLWDFVPEETTNHVRGVLGRMLFSREEVDKQVGHLSGGEAARLIFSQLMVQKPNVLLLDEPTNHLDLESIEALVGALEKYEGTLIFVSHDRWFVEKLATRIVEIRVGGLNEFNGGYDAYLAKQGDDHLSFGESKRAKKAPSLRPNS